MKVIDLLVKISKGEEVPKKIKWRNNKYILRSDLEWYILENGNFDDSLPIRVVFLNDEVIVIEEEKEIEKLKYKSTNSHIEDTKEIIKKVNELIDVINELKSGKDD